MRRALVAVLLLALVGVGVALKERVPIANWALARALAGRGLGPARPGIEALGFDRTKMRALSLCGGALTAQDLTVRYDLRGLASFHLSTVAIDGVEAELKTDASGTKLGACSPSGGRSGRQLAVQIGELTVSNAHIVLSGLGGPAEAMLSTTLVVAGDTIEGHDLEARISAPLAGVARRAHLAARRFTVMLQPSGGVRLAFSGATLAPTGLPIEVLGMAGELDWLPDHAAARFSIDRLVDREAPMRVTPVALHAEASLAATRLDFALHAAAGPRQAATLEAKGAFNREEGRGNATVTLGPIVFRRDGLQPADLVPAFRGAVEGVEGSVSAAGSLRFASGGLVPDLLVRIKDLGFEAGGAQVSNLSGAARLVRLWPPATAPHQAVTATVTVPGLPPAKLHVEGQLTAKPALRLELASLDVAGGTIALEPVSIEPTAPGLDTALDLAGVDLAEIIRVLGIDGLSGSGRLSGRVPLMIDRGKVIIRQGRLAAEAPGVLQYNPKSPPKEIAAAGQSVALALQALSDFHYDALALELDKAAEGQGAVLLHLDGRNPEVMNGQAFRFNIRIDSNFDRLAEIALLNLQSVRELLRQSAQRSEK